MQGEVLFWGLYLAVSSHLVPSRPGALCEVGSLLK